MGVELKVSFTVGGETTEDKVKLTVCELKVYYHNDTHTDEPYPCHNDTVKAKAILTTGNHAYSDANFSNDGNWYAVGTDGPLDPWPTSPVNGFTTFPTLSSTTYANVETYPSYFTGASVTFKKLQHNASDEIANSNRDYSYTETDQSATGWGFTVGYDSAMRYRYRVSVVKGTQYFDSANGKLRKFATRVNFRNVSMPLDPNSKTYLRWLTAFMGIPYEWGGHWFGGKVGSNVGGLDDYEGYGIDCSGLVSCGAKQQWSGYNWSPWRRTTSNLPDVSTQISNNQVSPGDILNKVGVHVVTVTERQGNTIDIIEATGATGVNKVRILTNQSLTQYTNNGYVPRRLNP